MAATPRFRLKWTPQRTRKLGEGVHYGKVRRISLSTRTAYREVYCVYPSASWTTDGLWSVAYLLEYRHVGQYKTFEEARQAAENDYLKAVLEEL